MSVSSFHVTRLERSHVPALLQAVQRDPAGCDSAAATAP